MKLFWTLEFSNNPHKNINISTNTINKQPEVAAGGITLQRSLRRGLDIEQPIKSLFSLHRIQTQKIHTNATLYLVAQASHRNFTFSFMQRQTFSSLISLPHVKKLRHKYPAI